MTQSSKAKLALNCFLALVPLSLFYGLSHFAVPMLVVLSSPLLWVAWEIVCIGTMRPKKYAYWLLALAPVAFWPDIFMGMLVFGLSSNGI
jgi:hypothetical protein